MLESLSIENFKCFDKLEICLSNINLFCGTNSSGKSTAIQALLLLSNNVRENSSPLNGQGLSLGSFNENRNFIKNAKSFELGVKTNKESLDIKFIQSENDNIDIKTETNLWTLSDLSIIEELLDYKNKHIYYLSALRQGPQDRYKKNFDKFNFLGDKGEYVIDYFAKNQKKVLKDSLIKEQSSKTLDAQVNYWLDKIVNVRLKVEEIEQLNSFSAKFSYKKNKDVRPYHIGTGVSYLIGIIIASLSAELDDIIIIENPEIHLHPKAQSDLMAFLCFIANAGIQIIIESHSDHIFNGIRKAVSGNVISKDNAAIHFFEMDEKALSSTTKIKISDNGRVLEHKKGLFDQFDDDLDQLLGL